MNKCGTGKGCLILFSLAEKIFLQCECNISRVFWPVGVTVCDSPYESNPVLLSLNFDKLCNEYWQNLSFLVIYCLEYICHQWNKWEKNPSFLGWSVHIAVVVWTGYSWLCVTYCTVAPKLDWCKMLSIVLYVWSAKWGRRFPLAFKRKNKAIWDPLHANWTVCTCYKLPW